MTPAAAHRVKLEAGQQACTASLSDVARVNGQYRAHLIKLKSDLKRLSTIRSKIRKNEVKREILNEYRVYLDGVLTSGSETRSGQDSVVVWCAVWAVDIGEMPLAIALLDYAIRRNMTAPDGFSRSLVETITEEICKAALIAYPPDYLQILQNLWAMVSSLDMSDTITAKLYKAYGLALVETDSAAAAALLNKAQALKPNIGVKAHIKKLEGGKAVELNQVTAKKYDTPTRVAARLIAVSPPTLVKYAALYPSELPYVCIESGKHKAFRFCRADVEKFIAKRTHCAAA